VDLKQASLTCPGRLREGYHSQAREHLCGPTVKKANRCALTLDYPWSLPTDMTLPSTVTATDTNASVPFDRVNGGLRANASGARPDYIPIIFVNNDKASKEDRIAASHCVLRF